MAQGLSSWTDRGTAAPVQLPQSSPPPPSASTGDVSAAVDAVVDGAPADLDTLAKLAVAIGGDPAFAATVTAALAGKQPADADLDALAALATTAFGRSLLELANAAAGRALLGLGSAAVAASGDFQPVDADLTAIAAVATTAYGRALLALADQAALRTLIGLATVATSGAYADLTGKPTIPARVENSALGFAVAAFGTVTQTANKGNGVALNALVGEITMNGATLTASTSVSFTLTNSLLKAGDVLVMNVVGGAADPGVYTANGSCIVDGSATMTLRNVGTASKTEAVVLRFATLRLKG